MNLKSTLVRFKFVEDNEFKSLNDTPKLLSTNGLENEPLTHIVSQPQVLYRPDSYLSNQYRIEDFLFASKHKF